MARYRKTAIAALAASALLLTPTAAYADHDHRGVSGSSEGGMSWGYYRGKLTDFTTPPEVVNPDIFKDATASALMISLEGGSYFRLRVSGIDKSAVGGDYGVHLHEKECLAGDGSAAGPHYNIDAYKPEVLNGNIQKTVSKKTEVWLDIDVNSDREALSTAKVSFVPKPGPRSIVLHALPTVTLPVTGGVPAVGSAGARLACLPFNVKSPGN